MCHYENLFQVKWVCNTGKHVILNLQEFYLPMQSGGILSPENLAAIFLNLQVKTRAFYSVIQADLKQLLREVLWV